MGKFGVFSKRNSQNDPKRSGGSFMSWFENRCMSVARVQCSNCGFEVEDDEECPLCGSELDDGDD
jgi:rubrerythrin